MLTPIKARLARNISGMAIGKFKKSSRARDSARLVTLSVYSLECGSAISAGVLYSYIMSAAGAAQPSKLPTASTSARPATASSAPSSSSTPAQHFQAPAQVIYDLSVARDPSTASESSWQDATESSLEWLLSLTPAPRPSSPKGKEKADTQDVVHWFCGRRGAKECYESAVFCLRLLAFKRTGLVDNWRGQFDRQVPCI